MRWVYTIEHPTSEAYAKVFRRGSDGPINTLVKGVISRKFRACGYPYMAPEPQRKLRSLIDPEIETILHHRGMENTEVDL